MTRKIRVGVLFGGNSAEHEVSLQSALNVLGALDRDKYDVVPIGINKEGRWFVGDEANLVLNAENPKLISLNNSNRDLSIVPGSETALSDVANELGPIDVVFPVLHGPFGEDGSVQGLLKVADVACVGSGVLGSAVGMDKDIMKRLLRDAGIPVSDWVLLTPNSPRDYAAISDRLGQTLYVKPANLGSSVGVHRVTSAEQFAAACDDAFQYDTRVIVEEEIIGREVECAVLGNDEPEASTIGEVVTDHDFYSYEAKYIDGDGSRTYIPADLPDELIVRLQSISIDVFKVLCCSGLSRVDSFVTPDGDIFVNEINTLPGFTNISMYPQLWAASGVPQNELIDRLIQLALERHQTQNALKTTL